MIILAFVIHLFFAWFQFSGDVGNHLVWGQFILNSPAGLYWHDFSPVSAANYPPLAMFIFACALWLYRFCSTSIIFLNQTFDFFPSILVPFILDIHTQMLFLKLPAIIASILIGFILYRRRNLTIDYRLATTIYLFNPAVIYLSSVWGQTEPVTGLLIILAFLSPSVVISVVIFALSALIKQTTLWLLPVFIIFSFRRSVAKTFIGSAIALALFALSYQPFLHSISIATPFVLYFSTLQGSSQVIADQAWNIWSFIMPASLPDSTILFGLSVRVLSIISLVISYAAIIFYQFKHPKSSPFIPLLLSSLAAFFLQTRVHERHLYPALLFCLFLPWPKKVILPLYILISIFFMANLYWSLRLPFI